jgi:glc operon protein GlcG
VTFGGGLPISIGGAVVGGIGVSGGSVEQDIECAQAGIDAIGN